MAETQGKRALISVYDKTGIEEAARLLHAAGWEIISTGGTAAHLRTHHISVTDVEKVTGFPHILDGRVKTLHPLKFGPVLAREVESHQRQLADLNTAPIHLVIVNFYPFESALEDPDATPASMVEKIDIGGPSMVRAAAKNHDHVVVVVDPDDYIPICSRLAAEGLIDADTRRHLARKAFSATAYYDALIARYFTPEDAPHPALFTLPGRKAMDLRYGENPHQSAALYISNPESPLRRMRQLQGKPLSFNNILDASMVYEVVSRFSSHRPFCVVVKHQNPCGASRRDTLAEAFSAAFAGDPTSAYGGIVGFNRELDGETADRMKKIFFEVIVAPSFSPEAQEILKRRKKLRLLQMPPGFQEPGDIKTVPGGFVRQQADHAIADAHTFENQTKRQVSDSELRDVELGWKLIKFVKSNGILLVKNESLIGVGAGQMSRVDSVRIALEKCGTSPCGGVLLSDAFFPFADSIEIVAAKGIEVVVEPGGSIRDEEVIAMAGEKGISLLFSGMRHFRH